MRKTVIALSAIVIAAVVGADANAAVKAYWDQESGKWIKYDTEAKRVVPKNYSRVTRKTINYDGPFKRNTIVINTAERRLYYVLGNGKALRYGVGVGREGFQWSGTNTISRKAKWPGWTPPPEMIAREAKKGRKLPAYMEGGPNNPLGARALYIGGTLYRIHGSNEPWTIGNAVSSGCIRLTNEDVSHLYDQVGVGTRVVVLTGKESKAKLVALANPPPPKKIETPAAVAEETNVPTAKDDEVVVMAPADGDAPEADKAAEDITGSIASRSRGKDDDVIVKAPAGAASEDEPVNAPLVKDDTVTTPVVEDEGVAAPLKDDDVTAVIDPEPEVAAN